MHPVLQPCSFRRLFFSVLKNSGNKRQQKHDRAQDNDRRPSALDVEIAAQRYADVPADIIKKDIQRVRPATAGGQFAIQGARSSRMNHEKTPADPRQTRGNCRK